MQHPQGPFLSRAHRQRLWHLLLGGLAVVAIAVLAVGIWVATRPPESPPPPMTLDHLDRAAIPADHLPPEAPPELVAVLGDPRGRNGMPVNALAFAPDGKRVASGDRGGTVRLWDAETLRLLEALPTDGDDVHCVAFSGNGKWLGVALGLREGQVRLWDVSGPRAEPVATLPCRPWGGLGGPCALSFSAAGDLLAVAGPDGRACLWDLTARPPRQLAEVVHDAAPSSDGGCLAVALTADGKTLATAGEPGRDSKGGMKPAVRLWDLTVQPPVQVSSLPGDFGRVTALALDATAKTLVVRYHNWKAVTGRLEAWRLGGDSISLFSSWEFQDDLFRRECLSLARTPDGRYVLPVTNDLYCWDPVKQTRHKIALGPNFYPWAAACGSDGERLVATDLRGLIRLWSLDGRALPPAVSPMEYHANRVTFRPDGRILAVSRSGAVELWDLQGQPRKVGGWGTSYYPQVAFGSDCRTLVIESGGGSPALRRFRVTPAGDLEEELPQWDLGHPKSVRWALAPDGRRTVLHHYQFLENWKIRRELQLWDISEPEPRQLGSLDVPDEPRSLVVNGQLVAAGLALPDRNEVWLLEVTGEGLRQRSVIPLADTPSALALTEGRLACHSLGGRVTVWDVAGAQPVEILRLELKTGGLGIALAFSPDGKTLTGARGRVVVLWDLASGKRLREWEFAGNVFNVAFAPDGRHLAIANADGTAYILRLTDLLPR
jgi:WD40 repeat protein